MNIESYATINESAEIHGIALIPRISRNDNLYTKEELARFHGKTVPLNWEHNPDRVIGEVTFQYDATSETVFYEGTITDPSAALLAKNKLLYTSIEAQPTSVQKVCNGAADCFHMPFGLIPEGLALTETPGVPETSVKLLTESINKTIAKCKEHTKEDHEFVDKYGAEELIHKTINYHTDENGIANPTTDSGSVTLNLNNDSTGGNLVWATNNLTTSAGTVEGVHAVDGSDTSVDNILQKNFAGLTQGIEAQLKSKNDALELFKKLGEENNDPITLTQIEMIENDISVLSNQLISLRKGSEYISVEHSLEHILGNFKETHVCECGELKKNEKMLTSLVSTQ